MFDSLGLTSFVTKDETTPLNYDCMREINNLTQKYCNINSEFALTFQKWIGNFCASATTTEQNKMVLNIHTLCESGVDASML